MALAMPIFGSAFAAVSVWLTVRIVNRRERWTKWALAVVVGLPVLYVASFGPACWIGTRASDFLDMRWHRPIGMLMARNERIREAFDSYARLYAQDGMHVAV